ncbi:MAG TPA: YfhO family protein [Anaerolineae bacterium]|nr:YfhO family protein [Anaerolineae bacterium]
MRSILRLYLDRYWPILLLIALPIVLLAPIVLGRVLYWGVPLLQFYPWQHAAIDAYQHGQLPLWNSLVGSGAPLAANLQTGAFYPLNILYLILPTEYAMGYTTILHVVLAGLFMYAFIRSLKLDRFSSVVAAIAFQLCGFLIARLSFFSITATLPWLAAWLWRTERLVASGQRLAVRNALLLALAIGLGILAGHAQTAVYGLIFVTLYFIWRMITLSPRHLVTLSACLFIIAVTLGLGLAAIQLLPSLELARESQRAVGLDFTKVMTHSYWPPRLLTMLSPDFFGNPAQNNFWGYDNYWENAAFIGVIPLLLALWVIKLHVASFKLHRLKASNPTSNLQSPISNLQSPTSYFILSFVVSLILAFGWFTIIYPFLYNTVPGFKLFQGPDRWLSITSIALCVLAGFGAQRLIDYGFPRRAALRLILLGLALSIAGVGSLFIFRDKFATFGPSILRSGILLIVSGFLFKLAIKNQMSKILLIAVISLDLIVAHISLNPTIDPLLYRAANPVADAIKAAGISGRIFYFDQDEAATKFGVYLAHGNPPRFDGFGSSDFNYWLSEREALLPNVGMIDGIASANNFDSLIIGRYQTLLDQINQLPLDQALSELARMNVAYIISPRDLNLPIVYRATNVMIYRNEKVMPRAWLAPIDSDLNQVTAILSGSSIDSLTDSSNAVTIRAASPVEAWLILSDTYYPGWQATLDGQVTDIQLANQSFRAVKFPAGAHQVEFRYEPNSVTIGATITLISVVVLVAGLAVTLRRRADEAH